MIDETLDRKTGQEVYSVTCDGDPECPDSMYWVRSMGLSTLTRTLALYGWEVVRKGAGPFPDIGSWCPNHAVNPPNSSYRPAPPRLGQPYGPGTENFINPL